MSSVADMDDLKKDLSNNSLSDLSDELEEEIVRAKVTILNLSSNRLNSLPPSVATAFSNLLSLDISSNGLTELPLEFCSLHKLKILNMKHNSMKSLPEGFGGLKGLRELNLSGNRFDQFSLQLCEMEGLEFLHLGGNFISYIPPSIKRLKRLVYLCM